VLWARGSAEQVAVTTFLKAFEVGLPAWAGLWAG